MEVSAELLARAQAVAANSASSFAEIAAVHDLLWPSQAPICPTLTCTRKIGEAWRAIVRALRLATPVPNSSPNAFQAMSKPALRLIEGNTYTIHNGATYTRETLTPELAASIVKNDPDAERLFEVAEEGDEEDGESRLPSLNRLSKPVLTAIYTEEIGTAPAPELTVPQIKEAIEKHRAASPPAAE